MPRKATGKIMVSQFRRVQKNGDIYVFERKQRYNPEKGYTEQLSSRLIGKIPAGGDTLVETRPRGKKSPDSKEAPLESAAAKTSILNAMDLLEWAGAQSGIDDTIRASTDLTTAQKILSIARFWAMNPGREISRIENWQLSHLVPYREGLTSEECGAFLEEIGRNEKVRERYFSLYAGQMPTKTCVAVVSTAISSFLEDLSPAGYGDDTRDTYPAAVRLITFICPENRQPVAFVRLEGDLPDALEVTSAVRRMDALGLDRPLVVLEAAYFSEENILTLIQNDTKFLMQGHMDTAWILSEYERCKEKLQLPSYSLSGHEGIFGTVVSLTVTHIFEELKKQKREERDKEIGAHGSDRLYLYFFRDAFLNAAKEFSCFVLVSNKKMEAADALDAFLLREKIGEHFRIDRESLSFIGTFPAGAYALSGRFFCQLVAQGYEQFLNEKIRKLKDRLICNTKDVQKGNPETKQMEEELLDWLKGKSLQDLLEWFDAHPETAVRTGLGKNRWKPETIARDRLFLKLLGVLDSEEFERS